MLVNPGDLADGLLVNAVGAFVRMVTRPRTSPKTSRELDIAGWADTEALVRNSLSEITLELPELTDDEACSLESALRSHETQAALQALLAARLTNAPETEARQAREAVRLAITSRYAEQLSEYYDDQICALTGHLEGVLGLGGLEQIRGEAYNSRIVALLGTIADMLAVLRRANRGGDAEIEFLDRYPKQIQQRHGRLQPPDFDRRRLVPIDKIYVNTDVHPYPDASTKTNRSMTVLDLADYLDRTVLLGDPGGGKTTAVNVIANYSAVHGSWIPFVVTLREYAAVDLSERSVVGHIERCLETIYQCPAPSQLVERLLLTGRAVVIFDGLDELLDTSRRREVSERVEQFCTAYPLAPVLVTSRLVGYRQAMLDQDQFTCYRLGDFDFKKTAEYVRKWFAVQDGKSPAEAEEEADAFIAESRHATDVRSNPLLLSLMCILYRGAGTLPRDRPTIYAKCAELLLGRWDESRRIRHELLAGHLVEPAIQDLAWGLFTSDNSQARLSEGQLIDRTSTFLHGRAFESEDEARAAAREFAEFLHGRMWVLSDIGTTANGEKLYAFTHRTFLEYFAAARLAAIYDSPEGLANYVVPRVLADDGWRTAAELALQIKSRTSDQAADRFYRTALYLMDPGVGAPLLPEYRRHGYVAGFLASCVDIVDPSPGTVRRLARVILNGERAVFSAALQQIFEIRGTSRKLVVDEIEKYLASKAESDVEAIRLLALELIFRPPLSVTESSGSEFTWRDWSRQQVQRYIGQFAANSRLRNEALHCGLLSLPNALEMPGGLSALLEEPATKLPYSRNREPYLTVLFDRVAVSREFTAVGRYLISNPSLPWVRITSQPFLGASIYTRKWPTNLDEVTALGFAALTCIQQELGRMAGFGARFPVDIQVPEQFRMLFRDWSQGKVNFTEVADDGARLS